MSGGRGCRIKDGVGFFLEGGGVSEKWSNGTNVFLHFGLDK